MYRKLNDPIAIETQQQLDAIIKKIQGIISYVLDEMPTDIDPKVHNRNLVFALQGIERLIGKDPDNRKKKAIKK